MPKKAKYYTRLQAACIGDNPGHIYAIAISHQMPDPTADLTSYLIDLNLGTTPPQFKILISGDKAMFPEYSSCFNCITKMPDGALYVGEDDGFIKYLNGKASVFKFESHVGISNCVYYGGGDTIFFGTSRGEVVQVKNSDFKVMLIASAAKQKSKDASVEAIHGIGPNFIVAVGESGLVSRFRKGTWERVKPPSNAHIFSVWCRSETEIYVGALRGASWRWDGESVWKKLKVDFEHADLNFYFSNITEYQGTMYAGCVEHGVYRLDGDTWVAASKILDERVCNLSVTNAGLIGLGALWGDSGSWLTRFDGTTWTTQQIHVDPG